MAIRKEQVATIAEEALRAKMRYSTVRKFTRSHSEEEIEVKNKEVRTGKEVINSMILRLKKRRKRECLVH